MKNGAPAGGDGEGLPVVRVRKYGNRRMYDLERKQYVALDEVARLVHEGRAVRVEDVSTGEDVTRATLVQALVEARGLARFLSDEAVVGLLRLDDERLGEVLGRELERVLTSDAAARDASLSKPERASPASIARESKPEPLDPHSIARTSNHEVVDHLRFSQSSKQSPILGQSIARTSNHEVVDHPVSVNMSEDKVVHHRGSVESTESRQTRASDPLWPTPVWPTPGVVGFGQGPPAGVYAAQPVGGQPALSDEVRSLRGEIDALRALLERAVRGGR